MKDKVQCQICGRWFRQITETHLQFKHDMTMEEYREKYPDSETLPENIRLRLVEANKEKWNRPGYREKVAKKISDMNKIVMNDPDRIKRLQMSSRRRWDESNEREKYSEMRKGENNPNWRGGCTPEKQDLCNSSKYSQWRRKVLERDGHRCRKCGRQNAILHCHHILRYSDYPELALNMNNGISLCRDCHSEVTGNEYEYVSYFLGFIFDDKGREIFGGDC